MNTQNNEKPWHRNAANYIVINSISAAISILVIGLLFQGSCVVRKIDYLFDIAISLNVIALFIFIITAEQIAVAVEDDVKKYIAYMLPYDFGVIFLTISLDLVLWQMDISWAWLGVVIAVSLLFCVPWVKWICWLLKSSQRDFVNYKRELEGKQLLNYERQKNLCCFTRFFYKCFSFTRLFYWLRRKCQCKVVAPLCGLLVLVMIFYLLGPK